MTNSAAISKIIQVTFEESTTTQCPVDGTGLAVVVTGGEVVEDGVVVGVVVVVDVVGVVVVVDVVGVVVVVDVGVVVVGVVVVVVEVVVLEVVVVGSGIVVVIVVFIPSEFTPISIIETH